MEHIYFVFILHTANQLSKQAARWNEHARRFVGMSAQKRNGAKIKMHTHHKAMYKMMYTGYGNKNTTIKMKHFANSNCFVLF